jgi:hypothetical protein
MIVPDWALEEGVDTEVDYNRKEGFVPERREAW